MFILQDGHVKLVEDHLMGTIKSNDPMAALNFVEKMVELKKLADQQVPTGLDDVFHKDQTLIDAAKKNIELLNSSSDYKNKNYLIHVANYLINEDLDNSTRATWCAVLRLMLATGADANSIDQEYGNNSLLHFAAIYGNDDLIDDLLKYGSDPSRPNSDFELPISLASDKLSRRIKNRLNPREQSSTSASMPLPAEEVANCCRII